MPDGPCDAAHEHCFRNEAEVLASAACGCFFCGLIFPPGDVREWLAERGDGARTAFCPRCGIDAVLGSASGHPITPEFIGQMRRRWFAEMADIGDEYWQGVMRTRALAGGGADSELRP